MVVAKGEEGGGTAATTNHPIKDEEGITKDKKR